MSSSVWYNKSRSHRLHRAKQERSNQALFPARSIKPTYLKNLWRHWSYRVHTDSRSLKAACRSCQGAELSPVQGRLKLQSCIWNWLQTQPAAVPDAKLWLCSSSSDLATVLELSCIRGLLRGSLPSPLPASWRSEHSSRLLVALKFPGQSQWKKHGALDHGVPA